MLSISVVDGIPLAPGEEFTGVIRTQDVRATEKDKVKIGECFRGGDVVRGLVVSVTCRFRVAANFFSPKRYHWVMREVILLRQRGMIWAWLSQRAKQVTSCLPSCHEEC